MLQKLTKVEMTKLNELKAREAELIPAERDEMDKLQARLDEAGKEE